MFSSILLKYFNAVQISGPELLLYYQYIRYEGKIELSGVAWGGDDRAIKDLTGNMVRIDSIKFILAVRFY